MRGREFGKIHIHTSIHKPRCQWLQAASALVLLLLHNGLICTWDSLYSLTSPKSNYLSEHRPAEDLCARSAWLTFEFLNVIESDSHLKSCLTAAAANNDPGRHYCNYNFSISTLLCLLRIIITRRQAPTPSASFLT